MTAGQIAEAHGGDVWYFDYDHLDLASTVALGAGSWGQYQANNVTVGDTIVATDADGYYWTSITLRHLTAYTTAHVHYEGSGFTLQFTLDGGTTWADLPEDGVITLGTHVDFDLRASFGANTGAHLDSLTIYILRTETFKSSKTGRVLTFNGNIISNGSMIVPASVSVAPASTNAVLAPNSPAQQGTPDYLIGTVEMWVLNQNNFVYSGPSSSLYVDGTVANNVPADGQTHHVVRVLDTAANTAFSVGSNLTISHLAVYRKIMNSGDVTDLYTAQIGGGRVSVADDGAIGVTEYSPAVDIYAYSWSVVQGGNK